MLSNYPDGLSDSTIGAPWNEESIPEKEFEVTCSQCLSKTASVWTDNYIPGASGVDYEKDDEGGTYASPWYDEDDTSDTNWADEYKNNGYKTPLELIGMLKGYLEKDLRDVQKDMLPNDRGYNATKARILRGLIEECDGWTEDETEYIEES